ncbi:MAG: SusC/RagA family TonB-linked outer membrane protein [Daejeonella sp.]|uniref:SusC/RagA family TonB-linked outer membrane protein n=1 Tax=Daejeonella sp. TaxID=2805397 RepID=UPI0027351AE8|nr:SusC/RagA family TonB-linked outer membrane protein [Daejeonella sp.]MDP3468315.1 SusC/RagA family TonB-linked outer membrane protein [Daejeonella sp.]
MRKIYSSGWPKHFLAFGLMLFLVILCSEINAQTRRYIISGKVTDAKTNETLPGVAVRLTSTTSGISTNLDGNYSLTADVNPGQYTVSFTYIGYQTISKTVQLGTELSVTLNAEIGQSSVGLDEVIITGTSEGTTRRQLGNYVGSVSGDNLNKGAAGNVLTGLQGKVAGAQITQNQGDPAGGMSVRLRGISSVNSSSDPLYIIDGVIANNATSSVTDNQQNRLVDINPADIDRIEVLNGAAAAAIYGSRANAGVVQIFTKRGSTGEPQVSFSSTYMNSELRKKLPVNMAPVKFGGPTDGPGALTQDIISLVGGVLPTNTTAVTRYDYQDYIFRNASGVDNNFSVSGGSDKTKFYTSASYFTNEGIVQNTDYTRFGLRANVDQTLSKWATFRAGLNFVRSDANEKPYGNGLIVPVGIQWIIANYHDIWKRDALGNLQAIGERGRVNPVSIIEDIKQAQRTNRVLANAGFKLFPVKNLTIDYNIGIDNAAQEGTLFVPPYSYNVSTAGGSYGGGPTLDPAQNGYASKRTANQYLFNNDLNITYDFSITSKISSTSQLGYSYQYQNGSNTSAEGRGLAPFVQTVGGASTPLVGGDGRSEFSVEGAYFQQNFKVNNNFFLTGAVRMDGSSVFGENQRNQIYLKGSGSYVLSSTKFWEGLGVSSWWDVMKVRAAYGESGNLTGIGAYERLNSYSTSSYLGRTSFTSNNQQANENVKPERQNEFEIGTDLFFLKNRLGLTFNYYNKKVSDLLLSRQIAPTTGFTSKLDNYGSLENTGIEFLVTGAPIRSNDFSWDATLIFNRNRNKATNVGAGVTAFTNTSSGPVSLINGQPIGLYYGSYFARDAQGNLLLTPTGLPQTERGVQTDPLNPTPQRNAAGQPTGTVLRKVIGNPNPDWNGSLVNEFSYKKLSFRVQLDTEQGGERWAADWRTAQGVGAGKVAEAEHLGLVPRGYVNANYNIEEWRSQPGHWVKLRDVSLSYRFGSVKYLKDLTLSVSGRNLISWDDFEGGYDPEVNSGGQSSIVRGIDFGAVPVPRSFNFGLQAKF